MSRKVVFDAIVYLQAVANPAGPSGACFAHARSGTLALITSSETIAADADYLASRDKDLLDLMKDREFTTRFPGIHVLDPASLLREIEQERKREQGPQP